MITAEQDAVVFKDVEFNPTTGRIEVIGGIKQFETPSKPHPVDVSKVTINKLPPSSDDSEAFDHHAFEVNRIRMVSKETGLAFSDIQNMRQIKRAQGLELHHRTGTPQWTLNDSEFCQTILVAMEKRYYLKQSNNLSEDERLQRIEMEAKRRAPRSRVVLDKLLDVHHHLLTRDRAVMECYFPQQVTRILTGLETQIQNIDTDIIMAKRGVVSLAASIAYRSYRLNEDSATVAAALQLKPPHVRQVIARMCLTARQLAAGDLPQWQSGKRKARKYKEKTQLSAMEQLALRMRCCGQ